MPEKTPEELADEALALAKSRDAEEYSSLVNVYKCFSEDNQEGLEQELFLYYFLLANLSSWKTDKELDEEHILPGAAMLLLEDTETFGDFKENFIGNKVCTVGLSQLLSACLNYCLPVSTTVCLSQLTLKWCTR